MLHHVALVSTGVSEERIASIIRVERISGLGVALAVTSDRNALQHDSVASYCQRCSKPADSFHPDDRGNKFLRIVGSYKMSLWSLLQLLVTAVAVTS
jgi:hypothetical protein